MWTVVAFGVALVVRLVYLADIDANPFFRTPVIDAEFYHQQAQAMAAGQPLPRAPFQMPPLYSMLLAGVYRLTGGSMMAAHVVQLLLGAATAALAFALGRRIARPRLGDRGALACGLVAAGLVATNKSLLFLEGDLLATPLAVFLDVLAVWLVVRWVDTDRVAWAAWAGIVFGLAGLALPLALVCVPVLAVWMAWRRRRWRAAAVLCVGCVLPIVPVTLRNWRASGEFVPVSANGGINLWLGNNPDWRATSVLRPGPGWRAVQELPFAAGIVPSSERDRWFGRQAFAWWVTSPGATVVAAASKTWMLVHDHDIMRDVDAYFFAERYSRLLRVPWWSFSWLFALAVVGLGWASRARAPAPKSAPHAARVPAVHRGASSVLHVFLASYALAIVLFFVTARYRAPLLPVLAVFAALGAVWLVREARGRAWRRVTPAVAAGLVALVVSEVDVFGLDRVDVVEGEYRVATTFEKQGRWADALALYDANLTRDPDHALSAARSAVCAERLGRLQEAIERYELVLERHPGYAEAAVNLGHLAARAGDREAAAHYYRMAVEADPYLPQAHAAYGQFLVQTGDAADGAAALRRAAEYDPTWTPVRVELANALLVAGDVAGALQEIEAAAAVMAPAPRLELVRGDVLAARGDAGAARAAWQRGLQLAPGDAELQLRLRGDAPR